MERYKVVKVMGDGTYGSVSKAVHRQTGQVVAIKQMKKGVRSWGECVNMREVRALLQISHPNIVKLLEVIKSDNKLSLVFEFLDEDIYHHIKERTKLLNETQVRNIMFQTLQGLHFMHAQGLFHRDLKPENLLITAGTVKVADFGLARDIKGQPPFTDYVSTRWYRAPEVLLRAPMYNAAIDIFAMGAVMAELYTKRPLFPGASEIDQLNKICTVMGTPRTWTHGQRLASQIGFQFPTETGIPLRSLVQNSSEHGLHLMQIMLDYDPNNRPSAVDCLQHPYFMSAIPIPRNTSMPDVAPQPPSTTRPTELASFSRQLNERAKPRQTVYERMKTAKYQPGTICR